MKCLRETKLVSSIFSLDKLMKTDTDKLVDKPEFNHQFRSATAKYTITTD